MPELENGQLAPQPQENILVNDFGVRDRAFNALDFENAAAELDEAFNHFVNAPADLNEVLREEDGVKDDFINFDDEDEDDDDDFEEELDRREVENRWEEEARAAILRGNVPPPPPENMNIREVEVNGEDVQFHRNPQPRNPPVAHHRRGQRVAVEDDRHIPAGLRDQPHKAQVVRPALRGGGPYGKFYKPLNYIAEGFVYKGHRFSRELTMVEKHLLSMVGYNDLIRKIPDLVYVAKEIPIDDNEECVILLSELADHLAMQSCKANITGFDIKEHTAQYQIVYKRYLKEISSFKRPKNG